MTTKFQAERYREAEGKMKVEQLEIELASPPFSMKEVLYKQKGDYAMSLKDAKGRIDANPTSYAKEDYETVVSKTIELQRKYNELLIRLCVNGAVKVPGDMEGIGEEYLSTMRDWLDKKLGLVEDKAKEGFTKT